MNRLLSVFFICIFSIAVLVACGSDDEKPLDDGAAEESTDTESAETDGAGEGNDGEEEIHQTIDHLDEEGWIFHSGVNLTIPDEFPSDYPKLDNYNVVERTIGEPDSLLLEHVKLKFKYADASNFLEAVDFYLDYYENGDFDVEYVEFHVEPTDEEGFVEIKAFDTDDMTHYFEIDKLHSDDYYQVHINIRNDEELEN